MTGAAHTRVAVYGASGAAGSLAARAIAGRGLAVRLVGRDRARLEALRSEVGDAADVAVAAVHDADALASAIRGCAVVANCAAPYSIVGEPVLEAAIAAGAHYLDIAVGQRYLREMYERHESEARHAGVTAACGIGAVVALGDWGASLAAARLGGDGPIVDLAITYAFEGLRPSAGARHSLLENASAPGWVWDLDRWEPIAAGAERRATRFAGGDERPAVSFPGGDVITVPRHVRARRVHTFLAVPGSPWLARGAQLVGRVLPALASTPLGSWARALPPGHDAGDDALRATAVAVVIDARRGFDRAHIELDARDVYGLTAEIVALVAEHLARGAAPTGVIAPSRAIDPSTALAELGLGVVT